MHTAAPPPSPHRRWPAAVGVAAAVLLLHAGLLGLLPVAPGPGWQGQTMAAMQVRQIAAPPREAAAAGPGVPAGAAPSRPPTAPARSTANPAAVAADAVAVAVAESATPARTSTPAQPGADTAPGGAPVPVYATRLPPPALLRYELRRGAQRSHALLRWAPDGARFELSFSSEAASERAGERGGERSGLQALGSSSVGHIGPAGLAPERHAESRRGRDVRAVNFEYDSARITFSGPGVEYPLVPGAQDRLSWMLQLAAILEANPALQATGSEIAMFVAGSRGDGEVWTFVVEDRDAIELPAGPLARPLHLKREPRRPYDTQVEVWLDPARSHLPVRMRQWVRPTAQGMEILLESLSTP